MINSNTLFNSTRLSSIAGNEKGNAGYSIKIPNNIDKKLIKNKMTQDEYLSLLVFAKHLPRGKQELKLNYPELRDQLIADNQTGKSSLNQVSGLRRGGIVASKGTKALNLKAHLLTIKNTNRNQTTPIPNVDYPYWKNSFDLKKKM
jgi:hypothetical protein